MLLGGTIVGKHTTPAEWEKLLVASRFKAVTAPFTHETSRGDIHDYCEIIARNHVRIAEIGVWRNTLSPDPAVRRTAMDFAKAQLALSDELGVPCCVNIVGSRGTGSWDGVDSSAFTDETYAEIIDSIREIIDAVKPIRAFYAIEPMPWMVPDGPDEYLQLIRDVDRPHFAAHMDFINMINCPRRYLAANAFIEDCFRKLGPYIKSTHIKDIHMDPDRFTTLLYEESPGKGDLSYGPILRILDRYLSADAPVLLEHMETFDEYAAAYDHVSQAAQKVSVSI